MRRTFVRRGVTAAATAVLVACFPLLVVHPAEAASEPVVVDVPRSERWHPRGAGVLGAAGAGVVYIRESDPGLHLLGGGSSILLRAPDGTETQVQAGGDGSGVVLLGNRIVHRPAASATSVASRVLPDGTLESLPLPADHDVVEYTGDGVLLSDGPWNDERLSLLPWTGGAPQPITGLPSGRVVHGPLAGDATGVVLSAPAVQGGAEPTVYVDTASRQAWVLPLGDLNGSNWSIGGKTLAWTSLTESRETLIRTMRRPIDGVPLESVSTRPGPPMPDTFRMALLPVGEDVVVSRDLAWYQWGRDVEGAVTAVHPDGSSTELLGWGHDVHLAGASIIAVGGPNPESSALVRVDVSTGATTELAALPAVAARTTQVAVDGNRLVYVDDSGSFGAAVQRQVTFEPGAIGPPQILGSPARPYACWGRGSVRCSAIAAAEGATAWIQGFGATTDNWRSREAGGTERTGALSESSITAVSGPWALLDARTVLDTRTGTRSVTQPNEGADLVDGVLYQRADAIETTPDRNIAILRDLATGASGSVTAPSPCAAVYDVEAAGAWLLLRCSTAETPSRGISLVVDRTGATPSWEPDAAVRLGNGFVVRRGTDGALAWASLTDPEHTWHALGTAQTAFGTFATSKGRTPTVAWADPDGQAHVALLPVATSAPAARPTGPAAPAAPTGFTAVPDYRQTTLSWRPSAPSERVTGYVVTRRPSYVRHVLPPDQTSIDFFGLTNGTPYTYTVAAQNLGGTSAEASVTATPGDPPPPPPDVVAPTVEAPTVPAVRLTSSTTVRLSGQDDQGYVDFDMRWRSASTGKALGAWTYPEVWQHRIEQHLDVARMAPGHTYCFSARSRDAAGNTSAWSTPGCTTVALDDRAMTRSGTWRLPRADAYYQGTATRSSSTRAALRRDSVRADAAWLVATRCPTCGSLGVYDDGRLLGVVDLRARGHRDRRVLELPWHGRRTGRLTLRVRSGAPVIDGMALRSYRPS